MDVKGKGIIVTGGASGLGEACARFFAGKGAKVVIADLNEEVGTKIAKELGGFFHKTNVSLEADGESCVKLAWDKCGDLSGLINCAGIGIPEKVVDKEGVPHKLKTFQKVIEVNLIGTFNMVRLMAASIAKHKGITGNEQGVIVNTASVAAFEGQIGQISYSASKGGIVSMTLPLAREFSALGIRVCTIAPGIFDTPMLAGLPEKVRASLGQQVPFPPRLGEPKEYALMAHHIFENGMLNGEVIRLDGALRMGAR
jgi:NAD(P)-dependent dehydrogenase (short-subunit alcohol dehydrogenase family)